MSVAMFKTSPEAHVRRQWRLASALFGRGRLRAQRQPKGQRQA
jgi:hypothetical protein